MLISRLNDLPQWEKWVLIGTVYMLHMWIFSSLSKNENPDYFWTSFSYTIYFRNVFMTLSNIYDENICKNKWWLTHLFPIHPFSTPWKGYIWKQMG